jgi:curli production assembly/transport component CsgG
VFGLRLAGIVFGVSLLAVLGGCATVAGPDTPHVIKDAQVERPSPVAGILETAPAPSAPVDVAVYSFPDQTGQFATNDNFAENSKAVTQGATSILIDVLTKVSGGKWFSVVEREGLQALITERDLIQKTRLAYQGKKAEALPALRFAGVIIQGGITGYDTNTSTGGAGAQYLGIGGNVEHRTDIVTVSLRAVSVSTGKVLTSVTTTKTIYSVVGRGGVFMFAAADKILELEAGYSRNEPREIAVREAMELAVMSMIIQGVETGQFSFADAAAGKAFMDTYKEKFGDATP